jgi:PhoPQ-activated pathogenicity-related protein
MFVAFAVAICSVASAEDDASKFLSDYIKKEDKTFAWKLKKTDENNGSKIYTFSLTSQTWQDIPWEHDLQIFVPKGAKPQSTMVLWNQGGTAGAESLLGLAISEKVGAPVAFLYGVPKQPLYENPKTKKLTTTPTNPNDKNEGRMVEDALIAYTYVKYLETQDASWPLLFPMVKSVVRAMDAIQAFAKDEWKFEVKDFVVTGASKRGWTSWLTAASGDKRVKAIAPLVIDTLHFPVQMKNQVAAFGKPSEMIADYTRAKLVPIPETTDAQNLWKMVDPYSYRESLTVPKMIINGTNDPYWPQDALNSYWDDLKGEKFVAYSPNSGHDLREMDKDGKKALLPMRAVNTLSAFSKCQVFNKEMPTLNWKWDTDKNKYTVDTKGTILKARCWTCDSDTKDFRKSYWKEQSSATPKDDGKPYVGSYSKEEGFRAPEKGYRAVMAEVEFDIHGVPANLTTQVQIIEAKK